MKPVLHDNETVFSECIDCHGLFEERDLDENCRCKDCQELDELTKSCDSLYYEEGGIPQ